MTYSYTSPSPTGLITILSSGDAAETIIPGMDATGIPIGESLPVEINLWEAMNKSGVAKGSIARLRDGGLGGTVLATRAFTDLGDSTAGHQQQWSFSSAGIASTTGRLCVTIQQTAGSPQITSDIHSFTVGQVVPAAQPYDQAVLADAPVAYFRLGEASGTVLTDSSGASRHGTYYGSPTLGAAGLLAGDTDTSVTFDGTDDRGSVVYGSWMNSTAFTVEALVRPDAVNVGNQTILDRRIADSVNQAFQLRIAGDKLDLLIFQGSSIARSFVGSAAFAPGVTYHVAATYDGITTRLYVNGQLDAASAANVVINHPSTPLTVGASLWSATGVGGPASEHFKGRVDEAAYYSQALNSSRIAAHYEAATVVAPTAPIGTLAAALPALTVALDGTYIGPPAVGTLSAALPALTASLSGTYAEPPVTLAAHYKLDETSGTTAVDSEHGRNATWTGTPTFGTAGLVADGGTAVTLSGDDYATVPYAAWMDTPHVSVAASVSTLATIGALAVRADITGSIWSLHINEDRAQFTVKVGGNWHTIAGPAGSARGNSRLAGTYDGTTVRLYRNGAEIATKAVTGSLNTGAYPIHMGREPGIQFLTGVLDDVKVWTGALTAGEVQAEYLGTAAVPVGTLAATLPALTADLSGTYTAPVVEVPTGTLAATLPALTAALSGTYTSPTFIDTSTRYANDGYNYDGTAAVLYDPPIAPTPAGINRAKVRRVHQSLPAPTLVDGRPT